MGDNINTYISHSKQQMYETLPARHELNPRKLGTLVSDLPRYVETVFTFFYKIILRGD